MSKFNNVNDRSDSGSIPPIKKLRESQSKGSTGNGFDRPYAEKMARQNQGTGLGEGEDEQFSESADATDGGLTFLGIE